MSWSDPLPSPFPPSPFSDLPVFLGHKLLGVSAGALGSGEDIPFKSPNPSVAFSCWKQL